MPLARRILQPLIVHREPLHDVFPQPLRRPDPELRPPQRFHPVAHGDDDIEVVELDVPRDLPFPLGLNCCRFCNSSLPSQFPLSNTFLMWREMTDLSRWNKSGSWLSDSHTVSPSNRTCNRVRPSSVW
jgi:hypothetical protein